MRTWEQLRAEAEGNGPGSILEVSPAEMDMIRSHLPPPRDYEREVRHLRAELERIATNSNGWEAVVLQALAREALSPAVGERHLSP